MRMHRGTAVMSAFAVVATSLAAASLVSAPAASATTGCREGATAVVSGSTLVCQERVTASGTWTPPAGVGLVDVVVVGGGGGGGGGSYRSSPFASVAANGGGAGTVTSSTRVAVAGPVAVTIGQGGAAGAAGVPAGAAGASGQASSFGAVIAAGGTGGEGALIDLSVTRGGSSGRSLNGGAPVTSDGGTSLVKGSAVAGGGGAGAGSPQAGPSLNASLVLVKNPPFPNTYELRSGDGGTGLNTVSLGGLFAVGADQWLAGGGSGGAAIEGSYLANAGYYGGGAGVWAGIDPNAVPSTGGGGGGGGYRWRIDNADAGGAGGSGVVLVRWTPPPVIAAGDLPVGTANSQFSATLAVTPQTGFAPFTWSVDSGSLPAGITLSAGGVLSGVPSGAPGTSTFSVRVVDARGAEATASRSITVEAPLVITTTSVPAAYRTIPYSTTLQATGGTTYEWYFGSGTLPGGLTLNPNGTITGTPTSTGTFSFRVAVYDERNRMVSAPFTLVVASPPALTITTTSLPVGARALAYSTALEATGGIGTHAWSLTAGALPPGLALSSGGLISGTPTTAGTYPVTVTVTAGTTASRALSLTVANELAITTDTVPSGATLAPYSATLAATGGSTYTWAVSAGSLPAGLTLSSAGVISGTPTSAGSSQFTVRVTDNFGRTESQVLTLQVAQSPPLTIVTSTLPEGTVSLGYAQQLQASGGVGSRTWSVASGSLPAGLALAANGSISGTPTSAGSSTFTVRVATATESVTQSLTIEVRALLEITTDTLPSGATLAAYSATLSATGGTTYTWALAAGSLPAGLSLASDGTISGMPTAAGSATFTVRVTDNLSRTTEKVLALGVNQTPALAIVTSSLPAAEVANAYSSTLQATGGVGAHTWSVASGTLPSGLTLHADGVITGVPTTAGTSTFTVRVTTGSETVTRSLSIVVRAQLAITTTTLPNGATLVPYSRTLAATGGTTYTWAVVSGSLPPGLALSAAGVLSGTPTTAGTATFTVQVTDNFGRTESRPLALAVAQSPALAIVTSSLPDAEVAVAYATTLQATGGVGTHAWSVSSGSLPAGMVLLPDGTVTGIPTAVGSSTFTVQVTTGTETVTRVLTLEVRSTLEITTDTLPSGATLIPYSTSLAAVGGAPYTWALTAGALPAGLSLVTDGTISGTPSAAGTLSVTVTVTDTYSRTESRAFSIAIALTPPLTVVTSAMPPGTSGAPYSGQLEATGGLGVRTWSIVSGSLPSGLSLAADGTVTGTPSAVGTSTFTVRVATSTQADEQQVTLTVDAQVAITTSSLPAATPGAGYTQSLAATGGDGSYGWSLVGGELPDGLDLAANGAVSGTVAPSALAGSYPLTVSVVDGRGGLDTRTISLALKSPVAITTTSVPTAAVLGPYSVTLQVAGGTGPYTWSQVGPLLPAGLALNESSGRISGRAVTAGQYQFRVRVTDVNGNSTVRSLSLLVAPTAAQSQTCATFPSSLPVSGSKLVAQAGCRTNAGRPVVVSVRCTWGITRAGDLRMCAVVRDSRGRQWVRTYGHHPITVLVTLSAPAVSGYSAYRAARTYRIR